MSKSKLRDGERFARLTTSLLESEAVRTLEATAFKLLVVLTLGARPPGLDRRRDKGSNGVQAVTGTYARRFGFNSKETIYRGLKALLERGLIVRTREGWRSKTHFSTYAVAWLPVTHRDGMPLDTPEQARHSWLTWKDAGLKPKKITPKGRRKTEIIQSDGRTQSGPMVGDDEVICGPIESNRLPVYGPIVSPTLRTLGGATRNRSSKRKKSHCAHTVADGKKCVSSISLQKQLDWVGVDDVKAAQTQ